MKRNELVGSEDLVMLINFLSDGYWGIGSSEKQLLVAWHGLQMMQNIEGMTIQKETTDKITELLKKYKEANSDSNKFDKITDYYNKRPEE